MFGTLASNLARTTSIRCDFVVGPALSLQSAIDSAANGSTICFNASASPYACEGYGGSGANISGKELTLTTNLEPGSAVLATIDCGGKGRFLWAQDANLTIRQLRLRNGSAPVGGLLRASRGLLRIENCSLEAGASTCKVYQGQTAATAAPATTTTTAAPATAAAAPVTTTGAPAPAPTPVFCSDAKSCTSCLGVDPNTTEGGVGCSWCTAFSQCRAGAQFHYCIGKPCVSRTFPGCKPACPKPGMAFFTAGCGNASTDRGSSGVGGDSQTSAGDPPHGFGSLPPVGGGGALFAKDCDVVIVGSNFSGNSARSYGGAALLSFSGNRSGSRFAGGSGPSSHARVLQVDGNAMIGNHAALLGGAVAVAFWDSAHKNAIRFGRNEILDCTSANGTGAGGFGVMYAGRESVANSHRVHANSFQGCRGGNNGQYFSAKLASVGGGGGGGFAVLYTGASDYNDGTVATTVSASRNAHDVSGNRFVNCSGGRNNSFNGRSIGSLTGSLSGGGGSGGFSILYLCANLNGAVNTSGNTHTIINNTLIGCTGGDINDFVGTGFVLGGGGGSGGGTVLVASVLWQPDGVSGFTRISCIATATPWLWWPTGSDSAAAAAATPSEKRSS
jgi:hypothetical protein